MAIVIPPFTIDLTKPVPDSGNVQLVMRTTIDKKHIINTAAWSIGMNQADFLRTIIVQGAQQVVDELVRIGRLRINEKGFYEKNDHV